MDAPQVSVVMPVHNGARFLAAAIESVLDQSFTDFELLVVDDGSTDASPKIIERYCRLDRRIRLLAQVQQGISKARNTGLAQAQGTYLAWLDADDMAQPNRLAMQAVFLDAHPETIILGSAFRQIDERDQVLQVHVMPQDDTHIRWHALFHSPFAQSTVMQRLDVFHRNHLEYGQYEVAEDYDLAWRMLQYGRGWNLSEPLVDYRIHPDQISCIKSSRMSDAVRSIAQRNIRQVGLELDLHAVALLRAWYYRFPRRFSKTDIELACTLLDLVDAFGRQPGIDARQLSRIRGSNVLRVMRTALRNPAVWGPCLVSCFRSDRLSAALAYGADRIQKRGK